MRIVYLSGAELPSTRANAVHIMKMCAAFAKLGHDVTLIAKSVDSSLGDPFGYYGVPASFDIRPASARAANGKLSAMLANLTDVRTAKPDLLYARSRTLAAVCAGDRTPLVFEAHEMPRRGLDRLRERVILRSKSTTRLVTISQVLLDDYRLHHPGWLVGKSAIVAHDGADLPSSSRTRRTAIGGRATVGYVGSLYPGKGIETILTLAQLRPEHDFVIVGGRPQDIAHWLEGGAPANVRFVGHVPHSRLGDYYESFDVALLPMLEAVSVDFSRSDIGRWTSPLKLFEYMAHALPIIASSRPTIREVLQDGKSGFLAPPGDPAAWASTLDAVLGDYRRAAEVGRQAKAILEHKYTWAARAEAVLEGMG